MSFKKLDSAFGKILKLRRHKRNLSQEQLNLTKTSLQTNIKE
jgi:hypothetical protein